MKQQSEASFLKWAASRGMGLDPKYPDAAVLTFLPDPGHDRFWSQPEKPERRPHFIRTILDSVGSWNSYYCWRHLGSWPSKPAGGRLNDDIEYAIFRGIGLPESSTDVVEFELSEITTLVTLVFATTIFGWSVGEDLYLVSDTASAILQTDHHGVIHASFRNETNVKQCIEQMKEQGFELPDEIPDETFKRPSWMK